MAPKLSSRQQTQLVWLDLLPPKLERLTKAIELMAVQQADESQIRGAARLSDELKAQSGALAFTSLAEGFGLMGAMFRRSGALQTRVRGLRELLAGVRTNLDGARRSASTPQADASQGES